MVFKVEIVLFYTMAFFMLISYLLPSGDTLDRKCPLSRSVLAAVLEEVNKEVSKATA